MSLLEYKKKINYKVLRKILCLIFFKYYSFIIRKFEEYYLLNSIYSTNINLKSLHNIYSTNVNLKSVKIFKILIKICYYNFKIKYFLFYNNM